MIGSLIIIILIAVAGYTIYLNRAKLGLIKTSPPSHKIKTTITSGAISVGTSGAISVSTSGSCIYSPWSDWGQCDNNISARSRSAVVERLGSVTLPLLDECLETTETRGCTNCTVSDWSWGSCNNGISTGERTITIQPYNSSECPPLETTRGCGDCQVSAWSTWGSCQIIGDTVSRFRQRSVTADPYNGGNSCPPLVEGQKCTNFQRPVINDWGYGHLNRGWYDAQGLGGCYDYCRYVGNKNNPWFSCQLADLNGGKKEQVIYTNKDVYTEEGLKDKRCPN